MVAAGVVDTTGTTRTAEGRRWPDARWPDARRPISRRQTTRLRADTDDALRTVLAEAQASSRTPYLVGAVQRDGQLCFHGAAGNLGEHAGGLATNPATVSFRIGSITKTFTAVLVLRLRDDGRLSLDDRLDAHLPGTAFGDRTLAQLLSHAGGVTSEAGQPWWERVDGRDWDALVADVAGRPGSVIGGAGRRFHYSNLDFAALGRVVEVLHGMTRFEALRAELLDPLGMRHTTYSACAARGR